MSPVSLSVLLGLTAAAANVVGGAVIVAFLLRDKDFLNLGIPGTFWVYVGITAVALVSTVVLLTHGTVQNAIAKAKADTAEEQAEAQAAGEKPAEAALGTSGRYPPYQMWLLAAAFAIALYLKVPAPWNALLAAIVGVAWVVLALIPGSGRFLARHPLADLKFFFFIFALIPVQTLFTYNWLVLPEYINRAYAGKIGEYFEIASNTNPILIFILTPVIAALTLKRKVYNMMIWGTFVMAAPAFLLALGPTIWTLAGYILLMTVGEAMWSPRFLQYAAEIAPEGRTGEYMGVAQLPWFLTKVLVPLLYSGYMMDHYCPASVPRAQLHTETMWLVFGFIAMGSTVLLLLAKGWIGKDFKTKA